MKCPLCNKEGMHYLISINLEKSIGVVHCTRKGKDFEFKCVPIIAKKKIVSKKKKK